LASTKNILGESNRMAAVQSPIIPVVGQLILDNPGTISLGQGVVNYGPPPEALPAIERFAANPDNHKYKQVHGIPELTSLIEAKIDRENGITVDEANQVVVTAGGNMAFMNAILAIADEGDEIILQTPYYFNHEMAIAMAHCKAVCVPTDENYQLQVDAIRDAITTRTRAIVTISPNNPSGAVYPEEALRAVNDLCRDEGIYHIHDEAYEYFVYDAAHHFSPGAIDGAAPHTVSLFSLSKAYGFASWRIGYMVIPAHLSMAVKKAQDTILICPPVVSQWAAAGALEVGRPYCQAHVEKLARVRHLVLDELAALGDRITVPPAMGAFYVLLRLNTSLDDMTIVERLVRDHKVAVIPGGTFGLTDGCYLRVAYGALEESSITEGMGRFVQGLQTILGDA
jgi:aspartate/methionine/tyrosine aminotransferase